MTKALKRLLILALALVLSASAFAGCDKSKNGSEGGTNAGNGTTNGTSTETETESGTEAPLEDFDFSSVDITKYITISESDYLDSKVTLDTSYIISDDAVDQYIEDERFGKKTKTNGDTQVTDQPVKLGDSAFIYYTGYLDGKAFSGGSNASDAKPYELSIGSGSFIPGFEEGLIGIIPEDTSKDMPYELHVTFPENYGNADLAGKAVIFEVWIEYVVQYTIPELTEDYVKNTVKFDGTVEEYKAHVKKTLQEESDAKAESEALGSVISNLMEKATVHEYPQQSVDYWYSMYIDQFEYYMQMYAMYGMSFKTFDEFAIWYMGLKEGDDWKAVLTGYSKDMTKNVMIYYAVAAQQKLSVSDEEIRLTAEELAKQYSTANKTYTADEIIEQMGESRIRQNILMEKVDRLLTEECTIEYKDK